MSPHYFHLPSGNLELLQLSGPDAVQFLQGQITCDVANLADGATMRGAACNNKGRVFACFLLLRRGDDFLLVCNPGITAPFLTQLSKYLPFYKCELRQMTTGCALHGITSPQLDALYPALGLPPAQPGTVCNHNSGWLARLDAERALLSLPENMALPWPPEHEVQQLSASEWLALELLHGHYPLQPEDLERFTPQELHLDRHDYVSFSKGCYTGQEIVARMHYRGKTKKQLYRFICAADALSDESSTLYYPEHQPQGQVLKQLPAADGSMYVLVQLPVSLETADGTIQLSDHHGRLVTGQVF